MSDRPRLSASAVGPLARFDAWAETLESHSAGLVPADVALLVARVIFGFPLLMNGVGQIAMPGIMEAQMSLFGVSLAWKWPAILASLLGGLAILVGWRVRLAAALLVIYVVAATLLFHNTHTLLDGDDPLAVPELARRLCEWHVYDFKGVARGQVSEEFIHGCAVYRLWFDGAKTMDHLTMMVPALLMLVATGGGRYSIEAFFRRRRKD